MKTHEELIEEVYANPSFRSEFRCYANLQATLKAEIDAWAQARIQQPAPWSGKKYVGIGYEDLSGQTGFLPSQITKRIQDVKILYFSLEKALSIRFNIDHKQAGTLVRDVANRYA